MRYVGGHWKNVSSDINKRRKQVITNAQSLWRSQPSDKLKEYCLNTITYGTTPASYLTTTCLEKLAHEYEKKAQFAAQAIKSDFYMDDLLTGTNKLEDAINLREKVINILNSAGFINNEIKLNV